MIHTLNMPIPSTTKTSQNITNRSRAHAQHITIICPNHHMPKTSPSYTQSMPNASPHNTQLIFKMRGGITKPCLNHNTTSPVQTCLIELSVFSCDRLSIACWPQKKEQSRNSSRRNRVARWTRVQYVRLLWLLNAGPGLEKHSCPREFVHVGV